MHVTVLHILPGAEQEAEAPGGPDEHKETKVKTERCYVSGMRRRRGRRRTGRGKEEQQETDVEPQISPSSQTSGSSSRIALERLPALTR